MLGCQEEGPHLHVVPRENSNGARVKNGKHRVVPVTRGFVNLYDRYRTDRDACRQVDDSDFVFVNLFRAPLGEPMKLHALNDLFARLEPPGRDIGYPHMLRHIFGTEAAGRRRCDVVPNSFVTRICAQRRRICIETPDDSATPSSRRAVSASGDGGGIVTGFRSALVLLPQSDDVDAIAPAFDVWLEAAGWMPTK